jgi:hypothetical protein
LLLHHELSFSLASAAASPPPPRRVKSELHVPWTADRERVTLDA